MSSNAPRRPQPEAHQSERRIAERAPRSWTGHVTVSSDGGTCEIPGVWHLDMPGAERALGGDDRRSLPLPHRDDLSAWRAHLVQLVTLRLPGVQLRVSSADAAGWRMLELAAPTTPPSVVQIDPAGLRAMLGRDARITLSLNTQSAPR